MSNDSTIHLSSPCARLSEAFASEIRQHPLYLYHTNARWKRIARDVFCEPWQLGFFLGLLTIAILGLIAGMLSAALEPALGADYGLVLIALITASLATITIASAFWIKRYVIRPGNAWVESLSEDWRGVVSQVAHEAIDQVCREIDHHDAIDQQQRDNIKNKVQNDARLILRDLFSDDIKERQEAVIQVFAPSQAPIVSLQYRVDDAAKSVQRGYDHLEKDKQRAAKQQRLERAIGASASHPEKTQASESQ